MESTIESRSDRTVSVDIERAAALGHWRVTFVSEAVPGTLAVFAGVLALRGLDIVSAVMQRNGDLVTDQFDVRPLDGVVFSADVTDLAELAEDALRGRRDLQGELRSYRRQSVAERPSGPTTVDIQTDSEITTGVTVRTPDRPGLLHDIAATLTRHGMRTRALTVLTFGGKAHDSFRVVNAKGDPVRDSHVLERLRVELVQVCSS